MADRLQVQQRQELSDDVAVMHFVKATGESLDIDVGEQLAMSEATFNQDLLSQPARYAWWATILQQAREREKEASLAADVTKAKLGNEARVELPKMGQKPTAGNVEDWVLVQKEYHDAITTLNWWDNRVFQLNYIVKAFEQRNNALTQLGASIRADVKNAKMM